MRNGGKNLGPSQDGFFSIKLTKNKKKQGWNVLYISGYDVTYAEFKTL